MKLFKSRATTSCTALRSVLFSSMFCSICVFHYITFCVVSAMYPQLRSNQRCVLSRGEGLCNDAVLCSGSVHYDTCMIRTGKAEHVYA